MNVSTPVYMDNQSTTRVDPAVVEAMQPYWSEAYGNAGSTSHAFGWDAKDAVDKAREQIAKSLNVTPREIVFTSGATESNNLAIHGVASRRRRSGNHLLSVKTEHKAVLDPLSRLGRDEFDVELLDVEPNDSPQAGWLDPQRVADSLRDDTLLVSIMLANNEIGVIHSVAEIAKLCRERGVLLHCDATQAVGKLDVDIAELGADLVSFSAHKMYGPKGIGGLFVRRRGKQVRLSPLQQGGGHEQGLRSGTLNVPAIVGQAAALRIADEVRSDEQARIRMLRDKLWQGISDRIAEVQLNGPPLENHSLRLAGNLNCCFHDVDGEALMMSMRDLAVSSGSACTSANPETSHVLRAIGLADDSARASLRFGLGRFNTEAGVDFAIDLLDRTIRKLRLLH